MGGVEIKIIQQTLLGILVVQTSYTKMRAESLFVLQLFDQYEWRVQKTSEEIALRLQMHLYSLSRNENNFT